MRLYITPSWRDAAEGHDAWSMESPDDRKRRSHTLPNGNANLQSYSDEAIGLAIGEKAKSKVSIQDRIIPQKRRLNTLYDQMQELENSYRAGDMNISTYSLYRDVLVAKVQRAEVLYRKAVAQKPVQMPEDEEEIYANSLSTPSDNNGHGESYSSPVGVGFFAEVIDELSEENSLKNILKKACTVCRTLVRWHNRTKAYVQTLKEV